MKPVKPILQFKDHRNMHIIQPYKGQSGLIGYWPFNGNANDESGNGNNGTVFGATLTTDRKGNSNSAYDFDGINNYIKVNQSLLLLNNDFSLSLWFFKNNDLTTQQYLVQCTGPGSFFVCNLVNNNISTWLYNGLFFGRKNTVVSNFVWNNWIYTWNSVTQTSKAYLNGSEIFGQTAFGNIGGAIGTFFATQGAALYLNGKMDDIRIYNRVLTPNEITQLYNE